MPRVVVREDGSLVYLVVYGVPQDSVYSEELENLGFFYDYGLGAWVGVVDDRWWARRLVNELRRLGLGYPCEGPRFYCMYPSELIWDAVRSVVRSLRR